MNNKLGIIMSLTIMLSFFFMMVLFLYWLIWPVDVLEVERPLVILNEPAAGCNIILQFDFNKKMDIIGDATIKLVNDYIITLSEKTVSQQIGVNHKKLIYTIPPNTPPGKYYMDFAVTYKVNPIRQVVERFSSEQFEIK